MSLATRLEEYVEAHAPPSLALKLLALWKYRYTGEPEIRLLSDLVPRGRNSVDIGAHRGVYSYFLARYCRRVYAYEPNPDIYPFLEAAAPSNVDTYAYAVSNECGSITMFVPYKDAVLDTGRGTLEVETLSDFGEIERYDVKRVRLDDQDLEDVGFMKIDVEGHELAVLEGATRLISEHAPILLVEIEQRHLNRPIGEAFAYIQSLGYRGSFLFDGKLQDLEGFSVARHQGRDPRYVNNFIFMPASSGQIPL